MTLQQLDANRERHRQLNIAYEMLESMEDASTLHGTSMDGMPHGSGISDHVGNIAIAIADLKARISQLEDEIAVADNEIREYANSFEDVRLQQLIQHRFISSMTWDETAELMGARYTGHGLRKLFLRVCDGK